MGKGKRNRQIRASALGDVDRDHRRAIQKVVAEEVDKLCWEFDTKYWGDVEISVIWALWKFQGWKEPKLKQFARFFDEAHEALRERYENDEINNAGLCEMELKQAGIDVRGWGF